jgi:DNA-directed RNA polymerase alpha subunit
LGARRGGELPEGLAAPARRALASAGVTELADLTRLQEDDVLALHGMGRKAVEQLRAALRERGWSFANS